MEYEGTSGLDDILSKSIVGACGCKDESKNILDVIDAPSKSAVPLQNPYQDHLRHYRVISNCSPAKINSTIGCKSCYETRAWLTISEVRRVLRIDTS